MKEYRKILFPYAYNILGSSEDAKDAVQDVLSTYFSLPKAGIANEKAYLIKSVINHAINIKKKRKKLSYEDVWLPEPVATEEADNPINLSDIVSYSMLILLEQLNPKERAVFILKEAFTYSHEEIAEVLSETVENSRKLLSRAKRKLEQAPQPLKPSGKVPVPFALLEKYIQAIRSRETKTLESLLSEDITLFADGGDKISVVKKMCIGLREVTDLVIYAHHTYNATSSILYTEVNHQPALLYYEGAELRVCQIFDIAATQGKIQQINVILDPEKLRNIQANDQLFRINLQ